MKEIRRTRQQGGVTRQGWVIAEGPHLVEEAARSGLVLHCVITAEGSEHGFEGHRNVTVTADLFDRVAATDTPQGVLALVEPPAWSEAQLLKSPALIVVLDAIQDPGNAGAIARAAEAFGATGLLFAKGSVSPWNPKTLRASAGSLFRMPHLRLAGTPEILGLLSGRVTAYSAVPSGPGIAEIGNVDLTRPSTIVIGNEGRGISPEFLAASQPVTIQTRGVESLNAAMAATVILYEAARQRARIVPQ